MKFFIYVDSLATKMISVARIRAVDSHQGTPH